MLGSNFYFSRWHIELSLSRGQDCASRVLYVGESTGATVAGGVNAPLRMRRFVLWCLVVVSTMRKEGEHCAAGRLGSHGSSWLCDFQLLRRRVLIESRQSWCPAVMSMMLRQKKCG